jgi:hypothetical protein
MIGIMGGGGGEDVGGCKYSRAPCNVSGFFEIRKNVPFVMGLCVFFSLSFDKPD